MPSPRAALVPCLAVLAAGLAAEDSPPRNIEIGAGSSFSENRVVVVKGLLDLDYVNRGQYLTGNRDESDHRAYGNIRTELDFTLKRNDRAAVVVGFGFDAEAGDNTADDPTGATRGGLPVVNKAFVRLNDLFDWSNIGLTIGRMPVHLAVSEGTAGPDGARGWLYDSTANRPDVQSWDGIQLGLHLDIYRINPFVYSVPGASTLLGVQGVIQPQMSGDFRPYLMGLFTWERKVPDRIIDPVSSVDGRLVMQDLTPGERLKTYSIGGELQYGKLVLTAEGAVQRGTKNSLEDYAGYGGYAALDYAWSDPNLRLGLRIDHLSGDDDPSDGRDEAFINTWEAVEDSYIVEHETYGEISRYLHGNLQDAKIRLSWTVDANQRFSAELLYAYFRTHRGVSNALLSVDRDRHFGQELDFTFSYRHTYRTSLRLFGGMFMPNDAFTAVAPGPNPLKDNLYIGGANLKVSF